MDYVMCQICHVFHLETIYYVKICTTYYVMDYVMCEVCHVFLLYAMHHLCISFRIKEW
jgi:hypothetical protein